MEVFIIGKVSSGKNTIPHEPVNPFGTREKKFFKLDNFLDVIRNGKTNALHIYRILISYLRADL